MHVVATAGHVDHGKSTLVRALTGMEPDRFAEEQRRGMTIDLGFAWTSLPGGEAVGFVDVPGHQRFLGNMLAGLGPSPAVLFVVAADDGWGRQSAEHLAAIDGLGISHGLLVVTRSDLADPAPALTQAQREIGGSSLAGATALAVSGKTRQGLDQLREALRELVTSMPAPSQDGPVRLWVDRVFTIRGAGTVVTGTLSSGALAVGDEVQLPSGTAVVRGLQSMGQQQAEVAATTRVAVNLRGVDRRDIARGAAVLTGSWPTTESVDVRLTRGRVPEQLVLHVGTAALPVRVRHLGDHVARLQLPAPVPLLVGDRALLRDPAGQRVLCGVVVLDVHPPPLTRRGDAARRAAELRGDESGSTVVLPEPPPRESEDRRHSLDLGAAEGAVRVLEKRLREEPFDPPSAQELAALGLTARHLRAAERAGRLLLLGDVVLLPSAIDEAHARLTDCPQPFSVAEARKAFGSTRPVAVALLEQLDQLGRTRRLPGGVRQLIAPG